jgi:hypothetical protein
MTSDWQFFDPNHVILATLGHPSDSTLKSASYRPFEKSTSIYGHNQEITPLSE